MLIEKTIFPAESKSITDFSSFHPVLTVYFALPPQFLPDTFLGGSAFEITEIYNYLKGKFHFFQNSYL